MNRHIVLNEGLRQAKCRYYLEKGTIEGDNGCLLWVGATNNQGYGQVDIKQYKSVLLHRFIAFSVLLHTDEEREKAVNLAVCHTCDVPLCINPEHLFLGSLKDNSQDAVAKGRHIHGETQGRSKLTEAQVIEIRERVAKGHYGSIRGLGREYGVSHGAISMIVSGKRWSYL